MEIILNEGQYGSSLAASIIDILLAIFVLVFTLTNSSTLRFVVNRITTKLNTIADQVETLPGIEVVDDIPEPHVCQIRNTLSNNIKPRGAASARQASPIQEATHNILEPYEVDMAKDYPSPASQTMKDSPASTTTVNSMTSLSTFVQGSGLDKFFSGSSTFLRTVSEKAAVLRGDPTTTLSSPENFKRLMRLSLYQLVIYCDDSGSMRVDNRYENQRELVKRLAHIATRIVPDSYGVELRFINADSASNLGAAEIEEAMLRTRPGGGTQIGTALRAKILQPLVYDVLDDVTRHLDRPLLVFVITDGHPEREPFGAFKDAILECKQKLLKAGYQPNSVVFSVSQIGNNEKAQAFLDGMRNDDDLQDVLTCSSVLLDEEFKALQGDEGKVETWLLKLLAAPVMGQDEV
ncbi:hypothetical protein NM688_g7879 [Phlebia brevispora]|uniref:Uncharacterized protein n=1 Tax=Phlebia brevispora TaxID=194682 RepID=A0ACC1S007_9APHY|nr:hypothetical protein NM688_g7879 [Phlebia brevispora]